MKPNQLPPNISRRLRSLRWRIRRYIWLQGLALAVAWVGFAYWVGLALDYLPVLVGSDEMPRAARTVLITVVSAVLAWILYRWLLRRAFVRLGDGSMALLLERRFPELEDSLLTAVSTPDRDSKSELSNIKEAMAQRAIDLANERSAHLNPRKVLNMRPLLRSGFSALLAVISIAAFALIARQACATWTSRFLLLSDEKWPRRAHVEVLELPQGTRKVGEGADFLVRARAVATRPTPAPEVCVIEFRTQNGDTGRVNMSRDGDALEGYQYYRYAGPPFQGMLESVAFDVIGFDHRVSDLQIEVVPTPAIVSVELHCKFPDYLNRSPRKQTWAPGLTLPFGTDVSLVGESTKPLSKVTLEDIQTTETSAIEYSDTDDTPNEFEHHVGVITETVSLRINLLDRDDVQSDQPYLVTINSVEDTAPQVSARLVGIGTAITPDARLPISGEIADDYGVQRSWSQIEIPDRNVSQQLEFAGKMEGDFSEVLDFRRQRTSGGIELKADEKIVLSIRANDNFDLDDSNRVGSSDDFPLDVVTADELLALLEARELGLKQRFEQILRELNETRDTLLRMQAELEEQANRGTSDVNAESDAQQLTLRLLRAQRAQQQAGKSQQEVEGVADSFGDIREELINNRVDTPERRERLQQKIVDPLQQIVAVQFPKWITDIGTLETELNSRPLPIQTCQTTVVDANELIFALEQVLQSMLELETYNELLDLVRSIIKEQKSIQGKTAEERKRRARALLGD